MLDSAVAQYAVAIAPYKTTRQPTLPQVFQFYDKICRYSGMDAGITSNMNAQKS
jgi:hypothetical protein